MKRLTIIPIYNLLDISSCQVSLHLNMSGKTGCLVIHGFGGSIREVKPLKESLEEHGYVTKCPALRGHTGVKSDLTKVCYQDWIDSAEEELKCLLDECDHVYIAGFSMGGLIGMHLSLKYPIAGLITINSPIYYLDLRKICSNIVNDIRTRDFVNIRRYLKPSNRLPLTALWNFQLLLKRTKKLITQVTVPLLVVQAIDDDVVQHRSAGYIYRRAGSNIKQLATYSRGGHVLLLSDTCAAVLKDIDYFLKERTHEIEQRV